MTNGNDLVTPYAWKTGDDGKTPVINDNTNALTKREYFAAIAMQGLCVSMDSSNADTIANESVTTADALIKALNKK